MSTRKQKAIDRLTVATTNRNQAEVRASKRRAKLFKLMHREQAAGNLTYREIAEITGLSEIRVAQILREERERLNGTGE